MIKTVSFKFALGLCCVLALAACSKKPARMNDWFVMPDLRRRASSRIAELIMVRAPSPGHAVVSLGSVRRRGLYPIDLVEGFSALQHR